MGGSSSLFSFLLAARGLSVTTVDLDADLVRHADEVAETMSWDLRNEVMDMRELRFDEPSSALPPCASTSTSRPRIA